MFHLSLRRMASASVCVSRNAINQPKPYVSVGWLGSPEGRLRITAARGGAPGKLAISPFCLHKFFTTWMLLNRASLPTFKLCVANSHIAESHGKAVCVCRGAMQSIRCFLSNQLERIKGCASPQGAIQNGPSTPKRHRPCFESLHDLSFQRFLG
jgi:hypothetical protein